MKDSLHYLKIKVTRPYNQQKTLTSYYSIYDGKLKDVIDILKDISTDTKVEIYFEK